MEVSVFHVLYVSTASDLFSDAQLAQVLEESRTRNVARGVTGLLVHFSGNFIQALEGDEADVMSLLERIRSDARHRDFKVLLSYHSSEREFPDWSMGLEVVAAPLDRQAAVLDLARTDIETQQGAPHAPDHQPPDRSVSTVGEFAADQPPGILHRSREAVQRLRRSRP